MSCPSVQLSFFKGESAQFFEERRNYMPELDRIDRALIRALRRNARITNVALAAEAGLSPSACLRRVQMLESSGVIRGYTALVAGAAPELGVPMAALLLLPLSAFLVDASLTLMSRVAAGERWWQPHVSHVYQRWVRTGRSHAFVTSVYVAFTLAAIVSGALLHNAGPWPATVGVMLWLACAVPVWAGLRRRMVPGKVGQEDA